MSTLCRCPYYYAVLVIRCLVGKIVSTLSSYISFPCMCGVSILWGKANQYYDISGTRLSRWICDCSSGTNSARPIWYDQIVEFVWAFPPNKYTSLTFPPKVFWSVSLSLCSIISQNDNDLFRIFPVLCTILTVCFSFLEHEIESELKSSDDFTFERLLGLELVDIQRLFGTCIPYMKADKVMVWNYQFLSLALQKYSQWLSLSFLYYLYSLNFRYGLPHNTLPFTWNTN